MSLDHPPNIVKHQTLTRDAFLDGRLNVTQPAKGFRAGLDSVLLGAAVGGTGGPLLDLGCGVGVAAMVALAHQASISALLVDSNPDMLPLATANLAENGFADRARAGIADVTGSGAKRQLAGLAADHFATVIANPPFFAVGQGTMPGDSGRAAARHMAADELDRWIKTAAGCAAPGGEVIFIHVSESLGPLLSAFEARFGAIAVLPLTPRPAAPATRVLVRGIKGSRAPLTLLSSRALHAEAGGAFAPEFDPIFRGLTRLIW
jgi:tRNA1(Val) A37 N6-methylase TrmN6